MAPIAPTLFTWQDVESSSDILRLRRTLESLDDAKLIKALTAERKGRRAVERLFEVLPGLGRHTAVDSKALPARKAGEAGANIGVKSEKLPDGQVRVTFSWFGFKLHLLLDATYELPLAFEITAASEGDSPHMIPLVEQAGERHPQIMEQTGDLAGDRGYDDGADKQALYINYGIIPLIPSRDLARSEK